MRRLDRYSTGVTLEVALSTGLSVQELKWLAALTGKKLPARKAELVAVIVKHLAGEGLKRAWQGLDELQRAAVTEVVHASSDRFQHESFRAKYGKDPSWGRADKYGHRRLPSSLGLFFVGGIMPVDLKARLREFVPAPAEARVATLEQLPSGFTRRFKVWNPKTKVRETASEELPLTVHETELVAQRELLAVLRLVDAGKIAVSSTTLRPSAAAVETVTAALGGDFYPVLPQPSQWRDENAGPIRAFAWPMLVQAGGLAVAAGTKLQLTKAGRRAVADPVAETIRATWAKWLKTTLVDELARVDCVKGQTGKGKHGLTAVSARRAKVAATLAACPVGSWVAVDELLRFARAERSDVTVTRDAWSLYVSDAQYGSLGSQGGEGVANCRYVLCLLLEYAATLGLVDVALVAPAGARDDYGDLWGTDELVYFSRYDGLMYLRLTPLGAYCLGTATEYQPPPVEVKPVLQVLPNLEVAAIGGELSLGDRLALDSYAFRVSDHVWRLDGDKLLAVVEEGRPVAEVREFLTARGGGPMPDTVTRLLANLEERSTQVRNRGLARLLECAEPALAALVANDARTRRHCLRAGDRHLVVPEASEVAFLRALRDLGYLVAAEELRSAPRRRSRRGKGAASAPNED